MDRVEIAGGPYAAPFKWWVHNTDEVYVTDADGSHLLVLNTYTQLPLSDLDGLEQEKTDAINIAKFIVEALNEKALRMAYDLEHEQDHTPVSGGLRP